MNSRSSFNLKVDLLKSLSAHLYQSLCHAAWQDRLCQRMRVDAERHRMTQYDRSAERDDSRDFRQRCLMQRRALHDDSIDALIWIGNFLRAAQDVAPDRPALSGPRVFVALGFRFQASKWRPSPPISSVNVTLSVLTRLSVV